jgi:hypothetical protein
MTAAAAEMTGVTVEATTTGGIGDRTAVGVEATITIMDEGPGRVSTSRPRRHRRLQMLPSSS